MSTVDIATDLARDLAGSDARYGEIAERTVNARALERLDPAQRDAVVTRYLTDARDRLASALEATGPEAVAAIKAEIATAAEATKQLGLSKEIQTDAQEMVRRAEFAVRKAVNAAQKAGTVRAREDNLVAGAASRSDATCTSVAPAPSPRSFFASDAEYRDANVMAELTADEFEDVLTEAKTEGNLSRANVTEKARDAIGRQAPAPRKPPRKALPETAKSRGFALRAATDSVLKIFDDDRYRTNEKQVADALRGHLLYVAETVAAVLDQLP